MSGARPPLKAASRSPARWRIRPSSTGAFQSMSRPSRRTGPGHRSPRRSFMRTQPSSPIAGRQATCRSTWLHAKITSSGGSPDFAMLRDGDLQKTTKLPIPASRRIVAGFNLSSPRPQPSAPSPMPSMTPDRIDDSCCSASALPKKCSEASDDGKNFQPVAESTRQAALRNTPFRSPQSPRSISASPSSARRPPISRWAPMPASRGNRTPSHRLRDRRTGTSSRTHASIASKRKPPSSPDPDLYGSATPALRPADAICKNRRHRPDRKDASRRNTRLDAAARQLGGAALRLLAAGHHQPSGHRRGHRA